MRRNTLILLFTLLPLFVCAQTVDTVRHQVLLQTSMGDILLELYNETPQHRDNFLKLVREGFYDGIIFHRVINRFMIQTGDSTTRHAQPGELTGLHSPDYTIPAEILFPKYFHKRGALAAAREGDEVNPERASSASQFYIVYGKRFNEDMLDRAQVRLDKATHFKVTLPEEVRKVYMEQGGTPHLDGQYTVFGQVLKGMDVVEKIQNVETDDNARPIEDIRILKATVVK